MNSEVVKVSAGPRSSTDSGVCSATGSWHACGSARGGDGGGVFGRKCNLDTRKILCINILLPLFLYVKLETDLNQEFEW